jgi:RNA polymerase sigma-70 factor (ECF subfamily)
VASVSIGTGKSGFEKRRFLDCNSFSRISVGAVMTEPLAQPPKSSLGDSSPSQQDFVRLLVEHERSLEGFVLALVPNWAVAEDIIQETKLRLWAQFDKFDPKQDFGAWARTIAHYQVLTYRKSCKRSRELLFGEEFLQSVASEESLYQEQISMRQRFLPACVEKLSEKGRNLLRLVYSGKKTIRQIAQELGRSEAGTYTAVQDARLQIHDCIDRELRKEGVR